MPSSPLPVAVLISGGGTTLRNLLRRIDSGTLNVRVCLVVSSAPDAAGLTYAHEANIPTAVICRADHPTTETFSESIFAACRDAKVELVVMGGFLKKVCIPEDFANRVMNIHPSLIPAFCGRGYYGRRVHQAVLDYGAKISGCTVHFVDNEYDHGPIILQRAIDIEPDDTAETLAARVFAIECEVYPEALYLYSAGRIEISGRQVRVRP